LHGWFNPRRWQWKNIIIGWNQSVDVYWYQRHPVNVTVLLSWLIKSLDSSIGC
jgi:hypothetical protein